MAEKPQETTRMAEQENDGLAITLAEFNSETDNSPKRSELTWGELRQRLSTHVTIAVKEQGHLFSSTKYRPGSTRANGNVLALYAAVLDFDHCDVEQITQRLTELGCEAILYTTHSHTLEDAHLRVVVPFNLPVPAADWRRDRDVRARIDAWFGVKSDPGTWDEARIYYWPAHKQDAPYFAEHFPGQLLDPLELSTVPDGRDDGHRKTAPGELSGLPIGRKALEFIAMGAPKGQQRLTALATARNLREAGWRVEDIAEKLWQGFQACEQDAGNPWTHEGALGIARDIDERPAPPPKPIESGPLLIMPSKSVTTQPDWEAPIPFFQANLPEFPTDCLPESIGDFVRTLAAGTQTPVDLAGMISLAVLAASCQGKTVVMVRDGWREPVNLYVAVVLPSGSRKSVVLKQMAAPIEVFESSEAERMASVVATEEAKLKTAKARLDTLHAQAAKAKDADLDGLMEQVGQAAIDLTAMRVPAVPRLLADDVTPEKLASLLAAHNGRMTVLSAEGDLFDLMTARYGNAPNFGIFLKAHSGDTLRVDRIGRPPEFVRSPSLTLGLAVQPDVLRGLVSTPSLRGRGLTARFLYSWPKSTLGHRQTEPPAIPREAQFAYGSTITTLLNLPAVRDEFGEERPQTLTLSPEAYTCFVNYMRWIEPQLAETGALESLSDWAGKLAGEVIRIAGLLHMSQRAKDPFPYARPIDIATIENAIKVGHYLLAHARASFAEMGADPEAEEARHLLRWIEREGRTEFTKRDAYQGTRGHFKRVEAMEPAVKMLVTHGYLRERESSERPGPGRKPSPTYEVNPLWADNSGDCGNNVLDVFADDNDLHTHTNTNNAGPALNTHIAHNSHNPQNPTDAVPSPPSPPYPIGTPVRFGDMDSPVTGARLGADGLWYYTVEGQENEWLLEAPR